MLKPALTLWFLFFANTLADKEFKALNDKIEANKDVNSSVCEENPHTGEKCYYVLSKQGTKKQAIETCQNLATNAHLLSIYTREEQEFIEGMLTDTIKDNLWIGLEMGKDKGFKWRDGEVGKFLNWPKDTKVDFKPGDCARMSMSEKTKGLWNKHDCKHAKTSIVCQLTPIKKA